MPRFAHFLTTFLFVSIVIGGEFQLSTMGQAQWVFPDPEVDYWLNAAYLAQIPRGYVEWGNRFQNRPGLNRVIYYQPTLATNASPDAIGNFEEMWQTQLQGVFITKAGVVAIRLPYMHLSVPELYRNVDNLIGAQIYPPLPVNTGRQLTIRQWEAELGFAHQFSNRLSMGIRLIPVAQRFLPDFYQLLPISFTDADYLTPTFYQYWQGGISSTLTARWRLGFSLEWETYQWETTVPLMPWYFQRLYSNLLIDFQPSHRRNLRFLFRLQHPTWRLPEVPLLNTSAPEYYSELQPITAIKTLAIAYHFRTQKVGVSLALVNDWGTVIKKSIRMYATETGKKANIYRREFEVYQRYFTMGISIMVNRYVTVRSGFIFGSKGYGYTNQTFQTFKFRSITRVPTLGISWHLPAHWQIDIGVLPLAGGEIVNSSLNNQNLYQFSVRYHLK